MSEDRSPWIEVRLPRCLLVFTDWELRKLLAKDPPLWELALKRGKGLLRQRAMARRMEPPEKEVREA